MKVIAVKGKSNTGKSTAIKTAVLELMEKHGFSCQWMNIGFRGNSPTRAIREKWYTKTGRAVRDIQIILTRGNTTVWVISVGDNRKELQRSLNRVKAHAVKQCDVFVCACHDKGATLQWAKDIASPKQAVFVDKTDYACNIHEQLVEAILSVCNDC